MADTPDFGPLCDIFTAYAIVPNAPNNMKFFDVVVVVTVSAGL
jgi:hypothetical protein